MGTPRFTPEFKEETVYQIAERGYSVVDIYISDDWQRFYRDNNLVPSMSRR